nr:DNA-binding response regulator [Clostridium chromiireducens]
MGGFDIINAIRKLTENYDINVSDTDIKGAIKNIELLHACDDGFITLAAKKEKEWSQFHYKAHELIDNIAKAINIEANVYISPNSFFRPVRRIENIRHLNSLYIDVDFYSIDKYKECDHEYMMQMINYQYFESGLLPEPTFTVFTGKGLAFYWLIEPCHVTVLPLWNVIQRHFLETLLSVGGDSKSIDSARVMRLAGSLHIGTNKRATLYVNDENLIYRLGDIQADYLPELSPDAESIGDRVHKVKHITPEEYFEKKQAKNKAKAKKQTKVIGLYNQLKLHYTRFMDLVKLQEMRNGYCRNSDGELVKTGQREEMCFLYRYWYSLYCNDYDLALDNTLEFNQGFKEPLPNSEVIKITESAVRAYEEWLLDANEPDESKRGRQVGNRKYKHKGYNYRNETLIRMLNITEEEMKSLATIIKKDLKKNRKNTKERAARRNEDGLTKKQAEKKMFLDEVQKLYEQGYKQIEIAEKLNRDKSIISRALKEIKSEKKSQKNNEKIS